MFEKNFQCWRIKLDANILFNEKHIIFDENPSGTSNE